MLIILQTKEYVKLLLMIFYSFMKLEMELIIYAKNFH